MEKAVRQYYSIKHSTTGFKPIVLFNSKDKDIFKKVKSNTIKSQKRKRNDNIIVIKNEFGLLCENFKLIGKNIKPPTFRGKSRYLVPIKIIESSSICDYKISLIHY